MTRKYFFDELTIFYDRNSKIVVAKFEVFKQ
jgi:hypothetical protein